MQRQTASRAATGLAGDSAYGLGSSRGQAEGHGLPARLAHHVHVQEELRAQLLAPLFESTSSEEPLWRGRQSVEQRKGGQFEPAERSGFGSVQQEMKEMIAQNKRYVMMRAALFSVLKPSSVALETKRKRALSLVLEAKPRKGIYAPSQSPHPTSLPRRRAFFSGDSDHDFPLFLPAAGQPAHKPKPKAFIWRRRRRTVLAQMVNA